MKRRVAHGWANVVWLIAGCFLLATGPIGAEVPDWIASDRESRTAPAWVSATEAISNGELDWELFQWEPMKDGLRKDLARDLRARQAAAESGAAKAEGECASYGIWASADLDSEPPLKDLIERSVVAVLGVVVDTKVGFFFDGPVTMIEVEIQSRLKLPASLRGSTRLLITHTQVEMKVGGAMICHRAWTYPEAPAVARRIAVFSPNLTNTDPVIAYPSEQEIFFETAEGRTALPGLAGHSPGLPSWDRFEERLKRAMDIQEAPLEAGSGKGGH